VTVTRDCPRCGGVGEVRAPNWGSRTCADPTVVCGDCRGKGWLNVYSDEPSYEAWADAIGIR
jgi:hypothetical protein